MLSEPGATHQSASATPPQNAVTDDLAGAHQDRPTPRNRAQKPIPGTWLGRLAGRAFANFELQGGPGAFGAANARRIVVYRQC